MAPHLRTWLWAVAAVLIAATLPAQAQTPRCQQLAEALLEQLNGAASPAAIDAMAEQQRAVLRAEGCDPAASGHDLGVVERKLNASSIKPPDGEPPIRLDELLRIDY